MTWFKSLAAAVIGGGASAAVVIFALPEHIGDWAALGKVFAGGAVIALLNYLKKSPLPGVDVSDDTE